MDETTKVLDNVPKSTKVQLSVVDPLDINDLTDAEVCVVGTNIKADSAGTPNEKLVQEFAESLIVGTVGIGVYCSMGAEPSSRDTPQLRNLLPRKIIASSAAFDQISNVQAKKQKAMDQDGREP